MNMTVSRAICQLLARVGTVCVLAGRAGALMAAGTVQAAAKVMPTAIEIATWNGTRPHLYRVGVPRGTQPSIPH